jgi:pimeloyl-ACP methyl ester carboxylesterase
MIQSFTVHIDQPALDDLQRRIVNTCWPDAIIASGWKYGVSLDYLRELSAYWSNGFDWRAAETKINGYPNFLADIDGYKIHFLHVRGKGKKTIPLIITHGWPGSFIELMSSIPFLTTDEDISFDVVIPSLPGYGFSQNALREGMDPSLIARLWAALMKELGYYRYLVQGGDLGAEVAAHLALQHRDRLIGLHLNYIPFTYKPYLEPGETLTAEETAAQEKTKKFFAAAGAYAQQHITAPLTLAYGLSDSPVGQAAWILQIFRNFSDPSKDLETLFARDQLLANISLYWLTRTIHSSIRLYGETMKKPLLFTKDHRVWVPVGVAHYPFPDSFPARRYVERGFNVQYWKDMPSGGHFAAMEQPELFSRDVKEFTLQVLS